VALALKQKVFSFEGTSFGVPDTGFSVEAHGLYRLRRNSVLASILKGHGFSRAANAAE